MNKLTWKFDNNTLFFYYSETLIHAASSNESQAIPVILWLRKNLELGLAEAKTVWDKMVEEHGDPPYTGKTFEELEKDRDAYYKELSKIKPMSVEEISQLIGEDDLCTCGHKGVSHCREEFSGTACVVCECNNFNQAPEEQERVN